MREEGIPGSKTNEGYGREEIPRQGSRRGMSKNENLGNAEDNGGIPLFIGN